jgi:neurofibromin 1
MGIIQRHPAFPLPSYLSEADLHKRYVVLESLGDPQVVIGGRHTVQKHIRNHVSLITAYTPAQLLAFREAMSRFSRLTQQIKQFSQSHPQDHSVDGRAFSDQLCEWQNVMYMVAVTARSGLDEEVNIVPEYLISLLPPPLQFSKGRAEMIDHFIEEVIRLLFSENITIRQSAKDTFGLEINVALLPKVVNYFHR